MASACLRIGSKSEAFHRQGPSWICNSGLLSDVTIEVGEICFHLHKFPLLSRSGLLAKLIEEYSSDDVDGSDCVLNLSDLPGNAKAFELIAKFCYGVKIEINAVNVVSLRCAAEYLWMTEDYGEGNLVSQTEALLNEVFGNWADSIKALETCEEVLPYAEELHIVSRCIDSLAMKACADPSLFSWPLPHKQITTSTPPPPLLPDNNNNNTTTVMWNGISAATKSQSIGEHWWYEDASFLTLPFYKRLILALESRGMKAEIISASVVHYGKRYIPLLNRQTGMDEIEHVNPGTTVNTSEADQRALLEEIVGLLPTTKGVTPTKFLLRLLRTAMVLHASPACREKLEKRVGLQLDQAALVDLLIPNMGYSETLYDIDVVQKILDHFMIIEQAAALSNSPPCIVEEGQMVNNNNGSSTDSLTPLTTVAALVDGYLAEVAPDVNFKLPKFEALALAIPDYARPLDDGLYRAIDVYLKAHHWITDSEREQLCRLMNCQKLSLEASTHAAQNERLPLRVIVQVLFFEQLRLRTSISGWFFVSENIEHSGNQCGNLGGLVKTNGRHDQTFDVNQVKQRVSELEKECLQMKDELQKLAKTSRGWKSFTRRLGFNKKSDSCCAKGSKPSNVKGPPANGSEQNSGNGGATGDQVIPESLKVA